MYSYLKILLSLFLVICSATRANNIQSINKVKNFAKENNVEISVKESVYGRENKQFVASLNVGYEFDQVGTGISFGYFLTKNKILSVGFSRVSSDRMFQTKVETSAAKISYKVFTGNSFYIDSGLFYLDTGYNQSGLIFTNDGNIPTTVTSNFKRVGAQIRIGNQWQWDNFTIGVDWIGYGTDIFDIEDQGFKPDVTELDSNYFTLLNLQLGMAF